MKLVGCVSKTIWATESHLVYITMSFLLDCNGTLLFLPLAKVMQPIFQILSAIIFHI